MLDILEEKQEEVRSSPEFLTGDRLNAVYRILFRKRCKGKLMIEIGLQQLKLVKKEKRKARNGADMMVLSFWKPPVSVDGLRNKLAYNPIFCYHMLQEKRTGSFKDNWFRNFSTCLDEKSFTAIEKGETYLCLVQQDEERFFDGAQVLQYEKGKNVGEDIILVKSHIVKVYPPTIKKETIKINYFQLYKFLE